MVLRAVLVSFRLGGSDGVAVEAAKWSWALGQLGFRVRRLAGELEDGSGPGDTVLSELAIEPPDDAAAPDPAKVVDALGDDELVVVENLCSLPLQPRASRAVAAALAQRGGRVVLRHHDLPWQRAEFESVTDLPPKLPGALHVTINELSRRELGARGVEATCIPNMFDPDPPPGDRAATRAAFGFEPDDVVLLHPVRAIPRKNVPGALAFAERLAARLDARVRYWLTGPAEDGYEPVLAGLLDDATVPVARGRARTPADAYAAADAVVVASTREGFGNPVIEAALAQRPLVVGHYPVLDELRPGFCWFPLSDPEPLAEWLEHPESALLASNLVVARRRYSIDALPGRIRTAFEGAGWTAW